ncbi:DUF4236 domain-containing protein [Rufibacter radiotolerans]|uniref:DUF4236 domain-containing protein n=1 Tax=Rufibacter radiotolerans TaxID=1379910 RepID=UPI0009715131
MGLSFRKTIKIGPLNITLSKTGIGVSIGAGGVRVGGNINGDKSINASLPGTGLSFKKRFSSKRKN